MTHNHSNGHKESFFQEHVLEFKNTAKTKLIISLIITFTVMIVEITGGLIYNSIALISDAGHMFTHCFAISISLIAIIIARKKPCHHKTYGLLRAEILAAFVNGLFLLLVVGIIIYESIHRIIKQEKIFGIQMLIVAIIGLVVNIASILILQGKNKDNKDINIKSVLAHMFADAISSVGIVIAAIIIHFTSWYILDPIVSIGIALLILIWAWKVLKESTKILLEMSPTGINTDKVNEKLITNFKSIKEIYNAHFWTISSDINVYTAHIKFKKETNIENLINEINDYLMKHYNIVETTIQEVHDEFNEICKIT